MKPAAYRLIILIFGVLLSGMTSEASAAETPKKPLAILNLLPGDEEITGWKRSERLLTASNHEELYKIFNGAATLYIQHGFQSFAGQNYRGPKGDELEVYIFYQGSQRNTEDLYQNPLARPARSEELSGLGEKARLDMTPLFSQGVEFIQKGFFVRIIVQDKTEEGLNAAWSFAQKISRGIP